MLIVPVDRSYVLACEGDPECLRELMLSIGDDAVTYGLLGSMDSYPCDEPLAVELLEELAPGPLVVEACDEGVMIPSYDEVVDKGLVAVEPMWGSWARRPEETMIFYRAIPIPRDIEIIDRGRLPGIPPTFVKVRGYTLTVLRRGALPTCEIEDVAYRWWLGRK